MDAIVLVRIQRCASVVLVAAVTAYLLIRVPGELDRGLAGLPGAVVYALTAGFGLEFLGSVWEGRWRRGSARRVLRG